MPAVSPCRVIVPSCVMQVVGFVDVNPLIAGVGFTVTVVRAKQPAGVM